jgi:hypothetical protein
VIILLTIFLFGFPWWAVLRLFQDLGDARRDRRWREALGHVYSGKMSMGELMRRSIQGRVGRR